ncbi:hypothetical protein [Nocardia noduli]
MAILDSNRDLHIAGKLIQDADDLSYGD